MREPAELYIPRGTFSRYGNSNLIGTYLKIGKLKLVFEMTVMYHWCMVNLADMQWQRIRHHFPEELRPKSHPGRKPVGTRDVFEAVLWILNTGAQWPMLPPCYPNYKTVSVAG